jgi:hypothetical protein
MASGAPVSLAPPSLDSITPTRILVGSGLTMIRAFGDRFVPGARLQIFASDGTATDLDTQFVSTFELHANLPPALAAQGSTYDVAVTWLGLTSVKRQLRVMDIITPAPVLTSLDPAQVAAGSDGTWITIAGSDLSADDTLVKLDVSTGPLITEFLSASRSAPWCPRIFGKSGPLRSA